MKGGARPKLVATVRRGDGFGKGCVGRGGEGREGRGGEGKFGYMRSMEVRSVGKVLLPARTQMLCDEQSPFNGLSS